MKTNTFVTAGHVISEATSYTADRDFKKGFSKGWYRARLADAIGDIAMDTLYFDMTVHLRMPSNMRLELPQGLINAAEVYVGNWGNGCCTPDSLKWVNYKRTYENSRGSSNYSAKIQEDSGNDNPFTPGHSQRMYNGRSVGNVLYCNEQNGLLMFSDSCKGYTGVKLVGHGMGINLEEQEVIIPAFFERYCVDYVARQFWLAKMAEGDMNARAMYQTMDNRLENPVSGSLRRAKNRIVKSSGFIRESMKEYITNTLVK